MEGHFHIEIERVWGMRVTLKVTAVDEKLVPEDLRKSGRNWAEVRTKQN